MLQGVTESGPKMSYCLHRRMRFFCDDTDNLNTCIQNKTREQSKAAGATARIGVINRGTFVFHINLVKAKTIYREERQTSPPILRARICANNSERQTRKAKESTVEDRLEGFKVSTYLQTL
ncbi:hypothetical protein Gasu2_12330 [Galdieria sulphuraria]|nr:hypothetical protein Gasu2_12330 [Galdieria sulphuraria]